MNDKTKEKLSDGVALKNKVKQNEEEKLAHLSEREKVEYFNTNYNHYVNHPAKRRSSKAPSQDVKK